MNLTEHFRRWFAARAPAPDREMVRRLRAEFSARYSCFQDLLSANQRALEAIAEMEQADAGAHSPGMSFVRGRATATVVSVFRMIQGLEALAPDRYPGLAASFGAVRREIEKALGPSAPPLDGPLALPLGKGGSAGEALAGPKMASLGALAAGLGLPVPPGLVITTVAYRRLVEHNQLSEEIARLLQTADLEHTDSLLAVCSKIQGLFTGAHIPPQLAEAVDQGLAALKDETPAPLRLALRSSAWGEDAPGASFAGQFDSELNVDPAHWAEAYLAVTASLYSPAAVAYRLRMGLRDEDAAMAVGCLAMIDARSGGVAYSADPLDPGRGRVLVNSCWGLPKAVVDGTWDCDQFEVEPGPPPRLAASRVAEKPRRYVCQPEEGVLPAPLDQEQASAPSLSEGQALELAGMALRLQEHYGGPQDVEWALDRGGRLIILQCRPLPCPAAGSQTALPAGPAEKRLLAGGVCASPGAGAGPLRWVLTGGDAVAFAEGEVLAVEQPLPRWAPLLSRAAAMLSVRGGVAGHLASVAREFAVPALLGLGPPVRELPSGRPVTVDATGRAVYRGLLSLPGREAAPQGRPDTPTRRVLAKVLALCAPLNLVDPEGPGFTPSACRTLHDLTRFCHQKAVEEMFSQAAQEHFPLHAARQLHYQVPMQWWVLDLGGGLRPEAGDKYVRLEDIACAPFHALWEGLTEVAWDGPPAMDAAGMASVMFSATANPRLGSGAKGRLAERNYFLLTGSFMNMQSQLGFHFSSLEAEAGGPPEGNFVCFCFRGGAADAPRRRARLAFLEEVLAGLGMEAVIKGEALLARAEGMEAAETLALVKGLGYLTMHARQLDMIMARPERVDMYRAKIAADLASLRPPELARDEKPSLAGEQDV
ncbi:MAG: hypothetical protein K9K66_17085 [Desulfarculaceae bacterium]|nr:hypothetical protein [Desulfarculaceae bacterium]MCF8074307.1 hypothetical protein [Desulfarculaceae bacterium]MCF8103375.1 hypothetical protein [Desulfarculaceae bacterium]MCF8117770.1 hypothetical protein [Desulfarculaceae bacterium]